MFKKNLNVNIHNGEKDPDGRFLMIYITLADFKLLLVNVYTPNQDDPVFFQKLTNKIMSYTPDYCLIARDFNLGLNPILDRQGTSLNNDKAASVINAFMDNNAIIDAWRVCNPDLSGFTWRKLHPKPMFSRLDYILVSEGFLQHVTDVQIKPGFQTNHSAVCMTFCLFSAARGPGYWKLNTSLLKDKEYLEKIKKVIEIEMAQDYVDSKTKWENIKLAVQGSTLQFASCKVKSKKNLVQVLEKKLKSLQDKQHKLEYKWMLNTEEQITKIKKDLADINAEKTKGAVMRSGKNWQLLGNRPTKYFLNLEKHDKLKRTIFRIRNQEGNILTDKHDILKALKNYYEKLYTTMGPIDPTYSDKLIFPQISFEAKQKADADIKMSEMALALKQMPNGKCPGTDGLPADFYKVFFGKIKNILFDVYLESIEEGSLHLTTRRGIISLLEKLGKDPLDLNCWRPLSLLNTDNKIYAKILANHLQETLPDIIHPSQTGFIKNRYLADNLIKINEILYEYRIKDAPSLIINFDFWKAFDNLEWDMIRNALTKFGFGENFLKLTNVLFKNPISYIINNGYWSDWFDLTRSCRQGCCFSPTIFALTIETLGLAIHQNQEIIGLKLGQTEIKAGQYADDLWMALFPTKQNVENVLTELHQFHKYSGLQINSEKSAVLRIGSMRDSNAKFYT